MTDDSFLAHLNRVKERYEKTVRSYDSRHESAFGTEGKIAYFSMEFGIHESLPLFAGGLGVLAGDHLKASSDLGLPLCGVGLLYRKGYFRQFLNQDGWQQEEYPETDFYYLPLKKAKDQSGNPVRISITGPDGEIFASVWEIEVGRIPCTCSTPIFRKIPLKSEILPPPSIPENQKLVLRRKFFWESAGCALLKPWEFFPSYAT